MARRGDIKHMDIYNMRLHEWLQFNNALFVIRVAGGWIYRQDNSMVFVPYNNEFNVPYKPKRKRSR